MSCGLRAGHHPGPEHARHDARRGPVTSAESLERLSPPSARVRARPVVGRWQPAVPRAPRAHGVQHPVVRPAALDRAGVARLAVRVRVALSVPRLRVRATAAAHANVAGLDRPSLLTGRVVEVRLDRGGRAAKALGDLCDRQALGLPIVASERNSAATLNDSIRHRHMSVRRHPRDGTVAGWRSRRGAAPPRAPSCEQSRLCRLRRRGTAIIIIPHDLGVVAEIADDIAVMYAGRIVELGSAEQIFTAPQHPYTWGLLKSIPRLDSPRDEELVPISGRPPSLINRPSGCYFHPRCPYVQDEHRRVDPRLEPVPGDEGHLAACLLLGGTRTQIWQGIQAGHSP